MPIIQVTVYRKNNASQYEDSFSLNTENIVDIVEDGSTGSIVTYKEEKGKRNVKYYTRENPATITQSSNTAMSGDGFQVLTAIEGGADELVFDQNKRYLLPSGDYDISIAGSGHNNTGALVVIEVILSVANGDVDTLELGGSGKKLYGVGFTEQSADNYLFKAGVNASSTVYHIIQLKMINGTLIGATNDFNEDIQNVPFVDIPDEPTNFAYWKLDTNIDDGDSFIWVDNISGISLPNGRAGKPTKNAGGWVEFNGSSQGLDLDGEPRVNNLLAALPAIAAVHATVKLDSIGSQKNLILFHDDSTNFRFAGPIVIDSTGVLRYVHRTTNSESTIFALGTTTLSTDTWYTISVAYNNDNTVDVYLDGVKEIDAFSLDPLSEQLTTYTTLGVSSQYFNGTPAYFESDIAEIVLAYSLSNFTNTMNKLISNQPS